MHAALLCLCKEEERTRTGTQTRSPPPKLSPMATSLHPSPRKQPGGGPLRCHGNRKCRAALAPPKSTRGKGYRPQKMADGEAAPAQQEGEMSAAGPVVRKERQHRGGGRPPSARDLQLALAELYEDEAKRQSLRPDKATTTKMSNSKGLKIDSFRSLRKPERSMSDDKENQRFYSGDSEYRGLQISGASNNPSKIVAELFKEAKEHGAVPLDEASRTSGDFSKAKSFSGGGYRLGDSSQKHSEYIYGENQDVQILLKLWRNGFSLDDGELRSYSDPINAQFLESVKRGEIPVELQRLVHGGQVNLDMEDHQEQEYVKPRLRFKAFSGEGQKLGSLTPEIVSTPSSPEEEDKSILNAPVLIDDSVPATKIQIRLADGSRLIQRFNQTHRIKDIRDFIIQSRPAFATTDFVLVTTFPNKELTDESLTLREADILNTVILQQLK
ncbi:UBX domain-containing protein 2B isoform X1 [Meleagris gallopavo]|uniref:UBX domain-containing protein 2B isoform X1 n=1 Tax=Meleagris gallopavo TaxID=9103 RepID=UPI000938B0B7|nr:UBX domain-containing protein 2B isoform X1 [Meleagris gallopavo]